MGSNTAHKIKDVRNESPLNYKPLPVYPRHILILVLDVREHHNHTSGKYHEYDSWQIPAGCL